MPEEIRRDHHMVSGGKVLLVFGSAYGQTEKIVRRLAIRLEENGNRCVVARGNALPPGLRLEEFDGFVVAGSVLFGRHQKYLEEFVRDHHIGLGSRPSMFLSVCGAMSDRTREGEAQAEKYRRAFLKRTGWAPRFAYSLAGAIAYTRYGLLTRWMMRLISRHNGGPVDTSRDWEFTDWDAVDRHGQELARTLAGDSPTVLALR